MTPAQRLELHLCREFVAAYIKQALKRSRCAQIDPNKVFMAARLNGLSFSLKTLEVVLRELQKS